MESTFLFLRGLGDRFSDFLGLENRHENRGNFCDVTDPEFGSGDADLRGIWAV